MGAATTHFVTPFFRVTGHLGSGQFGQVDRGVWHSPNGPVGVAIKTLRSGAREDEMVKFLQEAAIMGQFRHPNIVRLHGVVTMGEPVSACYWLSHVNDGETALFGSPSIR